MTDFIAQITQLMANPWFWIIAVGYWLVSAAIAALPMPDAASGKFYRWFFPFANRFAANLDRAAHAIKLPAVDDDAEDKAKAASAPKP